MISRRALLQLGCTSAVLMTGLSPVIALSKPSPGFIRVPPAWLGSSFTIHNLSDLPMIVEVRGRGSVVALGALFETL